MAKQNKEWDGLESSILSTNSAKMAEQAAERPQNEKMDESAVVKKILTVVLPVVAAVLVVAGVIVGGYFISEAQYKEELRQEEEEKKKQENMQLRDGELAHSLDAPELVENDLQSGITQLYYSKENGLMVSITFVNGLKTDAEITNVHFVLRNKDEAVIASAKKELKNVKVKAGESLTHHLYLEPSVVKIADDPLESISYDLQVTDVTGK